MTRWSAVATAALALFAASALAGGPKIDPDVAREKSLGAPPSPGSSVDPQKAAPLAKELRTAIPSKLTGLVVLSPTLTSRPDGTADIHIRVTRNGTAPCKAKIIIDNLNSHPHTWVDFESGDGVEEATIVAPRPGTYDLVSVSFSPLPPGHCTGKVSASVEVRPHADFPCGLYPGYEKESFGPSWTCVPETPHVTGNLDYQYLCPPGTEFKNYFGVVFGCLPPQWQP